MTDQASPCVSSGAATRNSCVSGLPAFLSLWILAIDLSEREAREPVIVVNGVGPGVNGLQ